MKDIPDNNHIGALDRSIRIFDIFASMIAMIFLSPLFMVIISAIKLEDGGPIFFIQKRAGFDGIPFRIFKFRSMIVDAENKGTGLFVDGANDPRITRIGRFLRKTSLDELPQLINILRGEMSIVGPRPGLPSHIREYTPKQMRRLEVRPGLTGWAQINGRNSLTWPEKIELDVWYIEHRSNQLNMNIIFGTIPALLRGGHYAEASNFSFDKPAEADAILPEVSKVEESLKEVVSSH